LYIWHTFSSFANHPEVTFVGGTALTTPFLELFSFLVESSIGAVGDNGNWWAES
jgi:hypothetical protein